MPRRGATADLRQRPGWRIEEGRNLIALRLKRGGVVGALLGLDTTAALWLLSRGMTARGCLQLTVLAG